VKNNPVSTVLDKKKYGSILTDDKLDYIDAQMAPPPRKTLHHLAVQSRVSKLSVHWAKIFKSTPL
jgi:hypothetical protein